MDDLEPAKKFHHRCVSSTQHQDENQTTCNLADGPPGKEGSMHWQWGLAYHKLCIHAPNLESKTRRKRSSHHKSTHQHPRSPSLLTIPIFNWVSACPASFERPYEHPEDSVHGMVVIILANQMLEHHEYHHTPQHGWPNQHG